MSYLGKVALKASDIRRLDVTSSTSATHTLTWTPPNEQSLIITINGVKQQNNYSISGVTLTLDTALVATDEMEVIGINDIGTTNVPGSGVITNDMLSSSFSVDTAELADDSVTADKLANSINTEIAANTAKVTNATHTGDVTGATALTIANDAVDIAMLSATGTASASTFLRGDNAWAAAGGNNTPAFMVRRITSHQSIAYDTWTKIEFNGESHDVDDVFDITTNYRFTVPAGEGGNYLLFWSVSLEALTNTTLQTTSIECRVNGTAQVYQHINYTANYIRRANNPNQTLLALSAADYVELWCHHDTTNSAAADVNRSDSYIFTGFGGFKLL